MIFLIIINIICIAIIIILFILSRKYKEVIELTHRIEHRREEWDYWTMSPRDPLDESKKHIEKQKLRLEQLNKEILRIEKAIKNKGI